MRKRIRTVSLLAAVSLSGILPYSVAESPATAAVTSPIADEAVAYQINASHDGNLSGGPQVPPLAQRWSRDLGGPVSYPLIVAGKVFVTAAAQPGGQYGTMLFALDATTGHDVWGPVSLPGTYYWSALTAGDGKVFALNFDGVLRAFELSTGTQQWTVQLPGQYAFSSAPTYFNGVVYTGGAGSGGTVYATRASDGQLMWTAPVANGDQSSPAVSSTGVYVSYACARTYDFDPITGTPIWDHSTFCSGGGGRTPVLAKGRLWVRDPITGSVVLDAATGDPITTFEAGPAPAFAGSRGFFLEGNVLRARDASTLAPLWSFSGDGNLVSAPIVVNGFVYAASSSGQVWALDATTGQAVWTASTGSPINAPDEHNVSQPLTGLGAGDGLVVVPASSVVVAFGATDTNARTCARTLSGNVTGPVVVGSGESVCVVAGARLSGGITIRAGGALSVTSAQVAGGIVANAPRYFSLCGSQLSAPSPNEAVRVLNATGTVQIGNPTNGCAANRIAGNVALTGNEGGLTLAGNTIAGALGCSANNPPPTNASQPNTVIGVRSGQCSGTV